MNTDIVDIFIKWWEENPPDKFHPENYLMAKRAFIAGYETKHNSSTQNLYICPKASSGCPDRCHHKKPHTREEDYCLTEDCDIFPDGVKCSQVPNQLKIKDKSGKRLTRKLDIDRHREYTSSTRN